MLVDETITNLTTALALMAEQDPHLQAHLDRPAQGPDADPPDSAAVDAGTFDRAPTWSPPVVGSPQWFLDEVREAYGQAGTDYEVDALCGLKVIQREELSEPVLVLPDGRWYNIVPDWARRTAEQIQSEEARRRLTAGTQTPGV